MIQMQTRLKVSDNSGAQLVQCIKIIKGMKEFIGFTGDLIIISIKSIIPRKKVKKKEIKKAVIIRMKKQLKRSNGFHIAFDENSVVIINLLGLPIGSRIFGPVTYELRKKKYFKIVALASKII